MVEPDEMPVVNAQIVAPASGPSAAALTAGSGGGTRSVLASLQPRHRKATILLLLAACGIARRSTAAGGGGAGGSLVAEAATAAFRSRHAEAATTRFEQKSPPGAAERSCESDGNGSAEIEKESSKEVEAYRAYDVRSDRDVRKKGDRAKGTSDSGVEESSAEEDVIVVATVGGAMAGISRRSGKTLWKRTAPGAPKKEGGPKVGTADHEHMRPGNHDKERSEAADVLFAPLVSTTTTTRSSAKGGKDWRTAAVPSTDGRVYLTAGKDSAASGRNTNSGHSSADSSGEVTAITTVRDLVSRAPFVDRRGRFYVGSRQATAAALDRDTGEVVRVVGGNDGDDIADMNEDSSSASKSLADRHLVWVGRVDYSVSVFDARSGETDVRFSSSEVLSVEDMFLGKEQDPHPDTVPGVMGSDGLPSNHPLLMLPCTDDCINEGGVGKGENEIRESEHTEAHSLLVSTPSGNLALRDPDSGEIVWVANDTFDTPVAFAVDSSSGSSIGVDIVPDVPRPDASRESVSEQLEKQIAAMESGGQKGDDIDDGEYDDMRESEDETIVGALGTGQLFAMPLGGGRSYRGRRVMPGLPHPHTSTVSSTSLAGSKRHHHSVPYQELASHYHLPALHGHHSDVHTSVATANKKSCVPNSPHFPACLIGSSLNYPKGKSINGKGKGSFLDSYNHPDGAAATAAMMVTNYHLSPEYFDQAYEYRANKDSRFRTFLKIMSSWIPPAVALAFVVSFELGRRERVRVEKATQKERESKLVAKNNNTPSSDSDAGALVVADVLSNGSTRSDETQNGLVQQHIRITDEVLGYGGHGTVVYRGTMDGRNVAVKRMLKTYHASADREISLLIESDGHPNVVRYFLKEVKGDFVYLALELCDLSLNDLIVALSKKSSTPQIPSKKEREEDSEGGKNNDGSIISPATKSALLQIASGVRHLHSLRIVHRDLKPQNILLAQCTRGSFDSEREAPSLSKEESIYTCFQHDEYVPKISDMGLGKQLMGQSSFGLSTLGNASLRASAEGSQIVGVGPGSVGWQAPEVMAQRINPESMTMVRGTSSVGSDSMIEASPMDTALSSRTSRSVDIFSLGCIFYCTIIPGSHPFGEWYEREANIMKNKPSTEALKDLSADASDLVNSMISRDPKSRPTASQVCGHPLFWSPAKRLAFLCELSDRLEVDSMVSKGNEGDLDSTLCITCIDPLAVERNAVGVVGTAWDKNLDRDLLSNVSRFRTYDTASVRDLLRLVRNKHHHYDELPHEVKTRIGANPDGLVAYFEARFPSLVMHCYNVCRSSLPLDDPLASKYGIPVLKRNDKQKSVESEALVAGNGVDHKLTSDRTDSREDALADVEASNVKEPTSKNEAESSSTSEAESSCESEAETKADPKESQESLVPSLSQGETDQNEVPPLAPDTSPQSADSKCSEELADDGSVSVITLDAKETFAASTQIPLPTTDDIIIWEGSNAAKTFNCRGWMRSEDEWTRCVDTTLRKRDTNVARCASDPKFRTRLCNHWDVSKGTYCPMRKKNKCVFAHGPVELRVKEGKKERWGTLVDKTGNNKNPNHSGGEDTYGAARSIECMRKEEGKWNTGQGGSNGKSSNGKIPKGRRKGRQGGGKK